MAGRAQQEKGGVLDGIQKVLDQVEKRRLRPMDVVDDQNQRPLPGEYFHELPGTPEGLLQWEGLGGKANRRRDPGVDIGLEE